MISIVVPVLNEEEAVPIFVDRVRDIIKEIGLRWEIVFVDDGSVDGTVEVIRGLNVTDHRVKLVRLSRNFGKEAALTAGLEWAEGSAVIPMDVDLQDPPELIVKFIEKWREGYDVVYGRRVSRGADTIVKRLSAGWFYRLFNSMTSTRIEPNVGDFRLMSKNVVAETLRLRERSRFMKGIFAWVGFSSIAIDYERPAREVGETKFNYWKLWNFALDGITGFSTAPLRIWTYVGSAVAVFAFIYMMTTIIKTMIFGIDVPGYASMMTAILFLGSVQLISLGVIGEYLGRMYNEVKQRPIYITSETVGFMEQKETSRVG